LTAVDIFNGKRIQLIHEPKIVEILEVNGEPDENLETSRGDDAIVIDSNVIHDEHDNENADDPIIREETNGDIEEV
jgi:hypothetical protein